MTGAEKATDNVIAQKHFNFSGGWEIYRPFAAIRGKIVKLNTGLRRVFYSKGISE